MYCEELNKVLNDLNINTEDEYISRKDLLLLLDKVNNNYKHTKLLTDVLDISPCTVSWIGKDLKYLGVNKQLADMLHKPKSFFLEKKVGELNSCPIITEFTEKTLQTDEIISRELQTQVDGVNKYYLLKGTSFNNGEVGVIIGNDITELKKIEQEVIFNEKMSTLGEISSAIFHEINTPLSVINMSASVLTTLVNQKSPNIKKINNIIHNISKTVVDISKIMAGMRMISRKNDSNERTTVNIATIINQSILMTKGKLKKQHVKLIQNIEEFDILINETQIMQVMINLLNNSIDAIQDLENKEIKILVEKKDNKAVIKVIDSGNGIPPELRDNIFKKFYTTKEIGKGTGLGLSISKQIIEGHNGQLYIDDTNENTCFIIELPLEI